MTQTEAVKRGSTISKLMKSNITGTVLFLTAMSVALGIATRNFATLYNLEVILMSAMITAVVGLSQMVIIATGGMNLAVGAIGGISAIICGGAMEVMGMPTAVAILMGLFIGCLCGFINGVLISKLGSSGVTAFLITLAMSYGFQGITLGITKAHSFYNLNADFQRIGATNVFGLPLLFYVMIVIAAIVWVIFRYLGLGRQILAFGANPRAAELYGVSPMRTIVLAHMMSGLLAGCAGIMLSARMGAAIVDIGADWMLFSFAAPIIGGTRQAGGKVSVMGTVVGALILASMENGLVHLNIDVYWMELIRGLIILLAVMIDTFRNAKRFGGHVS